MKFFARTIVFEKIHARTIYSSQKPLGARYKYRVRKTLARTNKQFIKSRKVPARTNLQFAEFLARTILKAEKCVRRRNSRTRSCVAGTARTKSCAEKVLELNRATGKLVELNRAHEKPELKIVR